MLVDVEQRTRLSWCEVCDAALQLQLQIEGACRHKELAREAASKEREGLWPPNLEKQLRVAFIIEDAGVPLVLLQLASYLSDVLVSATVNFSDPPYRIAAMLSSFRPHVAVTLDPAHDHILAIKEIFSDSPFLSFTRLQGASSTSKPSQSASSPSSSESSGGLLSHVYFTSGSTGTPKGCVVSKTSLLSYVHAKNKIMDITASSRVLLASSPGFDPFLTDVISAYEASASLIVCPHRMLFAEFPRIVTSSNATHVLTTPAMMSLFSEDDMISAQKSLKVLALGGEAMTPAIIEQWTAPPTPDAPPDHMVLLNVYGVTECCGYQMACEMQRGDNPRVLGAAFGDNQVFVSMGDDVTLVPFAELPDGAQGELVLAGPQVGQGYLNLELASASVFKNGTYHTGDIVRRSADKLLLRGRRDNQVKIVGQRVQLDEIETQLQAVFGTAVQDVLVTFRKPHLAAWLRLTTPFSAPLEEAGRMLMRLSRLLLASHVPQNMLPHHVHVLETMPLGASGKVDRKLLTMQTGQYDQGMGQGDDMQGTELSAGWEQRIADAIESVLVFEKGMLTSSSNFVVLGGDSLRALHVVSRLSAEWACLQNGHEEGITPMMQEEELGKKLQTPFLPHLLLENSRVSEYADVCRRVLGEWDTEGQPKSHSTTPSATRPGHAAVNPNVYGALYDLMTCKNSVLIQHVLDNHVFSDAEKQVASVIAASSGHANSLGLLLARDATLTKLRDGDRKTLLHHAAASCSLPTLVLLLDHDVSTTLRDSMQQLPLHVAARSGCGIKFLNRLMTAMTSSSPSSSSSVPSLVDSVDVWGRTPLHWAVDNGHRDATSALLTARASTRGRDLSGETPLEIAERRAQCRAGDRPRGLRPSAYGDIATLLGGSGRTQKLNTVLDT